MHPIDDTIAAIASAPGGAARGIIRLSGPRSLDCLQGSFRRNDGLPLVATDVSTAIAGTMRLPNCASPLPCDVYLWPEGRSYTGQAAAEVHTLGSPPLLEAVVRTVCAAGARPAAPGEFTLRAFLAGRIDLTQAEAVLGVVDAADPHQLDVALRQLAGGLAGPLHRLRNDLLDALADLEAGLDFPEEDVAFIAPAQLRRRLAEAAEQIEALERQMQQRGEARNAVRVVLVGRPNAGKSSLFNALLGRQAALISPHPGTTRDYLVGELTLDGVTCQLIDTAGQAGAVDEAIREIDRAAQSHAAEQARQSDLRILCLDATRPLDPRTREQLGDSRGGAVVPALTKIDAVSPPPAVPGAIATSSRTGEGLDLLRRALRDAAIRATGSGGDAVASTAIRCRHALQSAAECLRRAEQLTGQRDARDAAMPAELIAAELRAALEQLGEVVGAVYTDDVLDRIFGRFCIGK